MNERQINFTHDEPDTSKPGVAHIAEVTKDGQTQSRVFMRAEDQWSFYSLPKHLIDLIADLVCWSAGIAFFVKIADALISLLKPNLWTVGGLVFLVFAGCLLVLTLLWKQSKYKPTIIYFGSLFLLGLLVVVFGG